jgi:hypothetical protein
MLGWDMVGNCVFGAPVVIGSKNVPLCCEKSREALATCALSGCLSSTGTRWWEIGNFRLYAPPLNSCDQLCMYHGGVTWRNGIEISGISELCARSYW